MTKSHASFNELVEYRIGPDGQDFFTSYDEVYDSFDAMSLQENLLRGIYAYGKSNYVFLLFIIFLGRQRALDGCFI